MKVASLFGHNDSTLKFSPSDFWPLPKCKIGLEWEWENGGKLHSYLSIGKGAPYLSAHEDGSLRDRGCEVVTVGEGLFGQDLSGAFVAMHALYEQTKAAGQAPVCTYRCGFHAHLDIRDLDHTELHNLLVLYCVLEKPIFDFVGKDRWKSNFCVPWFRSDSQFPVLKGIEGIADNSKAVADNIRRLARYSALNCQAIAKLGSVEFRHMENSPNEIATKQIDFVKLIMHLKRLAIKLTEQGMVGEALFSWLKEIDKFTLLRELEFPLPTEEWDYPEHLMLAIGLVNFKGPQLSDFYDVLMMPYVGTHANWR